MFSLQLISMFLHMLNHLITNLNSFATDLTFSPKLVQINTTLIILITFKYYIILLLQIVVVVLVLAQSVL